MVRRILTFSVLIILSASSAALLLDFGEGEYIERFNGRYGPSEDYVVLRGSGDMLYDSHLYFEIERNVPLSSASLKVETVNAASGPWIKDLALDIGVDGVKDWEFSGVGYGEFGHVSSYNDDSLINTVTLGSGRSGTVGQILIPEDSEVLSAEMEMRARFNPLIGQPKTVAVGGGTDFAPRLTPLFCPGWNFLRQIHPLL